MSYQTLDFLAFVAIVLPLYYLLGKRLQPFVLLAANLVFYAYAGTKHLPFILTTTVTTYLVGIIIGHIYKKLDLKLEKCTELSEKKVLRLKAKSRAKLVLILGLFVVIGLLGVCKYTNFTITNINYILSELDYKSIDTFKIIMPIGISFYTFMAISYMLDIYWKRYKAEKNPIRYAAFLSYFPHVVQGPIDRYNEFKEQTQNGVSFSYTNITGGAQLTIWGFFKKLVIADRLGMLVTKILGNWQDYDGIHLILAFVIYSIQIYTDFSGCIDIVRGVSEMFGIKLRKNFNHPYFSKTMGEFWRRWHISLQEWFKDYIYFPVSASSFIKKMKKFFKGKGLNKAEILFTSCFPILVVWLITGIWHGASWTFVVWGLFHAALLIGSQIFAPLFKKITDILHINTDTFSWRMWQMIRTFVLCCIGRVFFRAESLKDSIGMFEKMFCDTHLTKIFDKTIPLGLDKSNLLFAIFSIILLFIIDNLQEKMPLRQTLAKENTIFRWIIILAGLFAVFIFGVYGPGYNAASFIYEQF